MSKYFDKAMYWVCKHSMRRPFLWLLAAILISVPALMQIPKVGLDTDLIRLLPDNSKSAEMKQKMDTIISGSGGFFAILLESSDKEKLLQAFNAVVDKAKTTPGIGNLEYINPSEFYRQYRYALVPSVYLEKILDFFVRLEAKVNPMGEDLLSDEKDDNSNENASNQNQEQEDKKEIKKLMRYLDLPRFHQSEDGRVMAIKVFPKKGITSLGKTKRIFRQLNRITEDISQQFGIWGGVGGSLRNSIDQYDFIIKDLTQSGSITFITVILVLIIGFRSIRVLPVVLLPLVLGLVWTLGSIPTLVGDLNTITSFLLLVSFGLGIDFSIHLVKRFLHESRENSPEHALINTFQSTGKSILVSGLTTALALFILAFSNFRGFSEFGIVGGYSLVMILMAMLLFLPAITVLGVRFNLLPKQSKIQSSFLRKLVPSPIITIAILVIVFVAFIMSGFGLSFDYDFSKMDVKVPQEQEIKDRFYQVYESVRSPGAYFAVEDYSSLDVLLSALEESKQNENSRIKQFHSIRELCPDDDEFRKRLALIDDIKDSVSGRWIDRLEDEDYAKWIGDIRQWSSPAQPPRLRELPENVRNRFASRSIPLYYIIPVYIQGDKQKGKNAMAFTDELYRLPPVKSDKNADKIVGPFGDTTVLSEVLEIVTAEGIWLVVVTFFAIFLLIWLNQHSFIQTLWIMLPLFTGMILTAGIMVATGLSLNFFNVVVFPTLVGMGVDDGVHYYRRWLERKKDTLSTQQELFGPLTLTTVTTVFGYIGIAFSSHPGLWSIGILACIGLLATWFTSMFLLPGLLKIRKSSKL